MTLNCIKLGRAVTFMEYLASVDSLIFPAKAIIWNKILFAVSVFAESCRTGAKSVYEEYLKQILSIFFFLFDFLLLNVKMSRVYNLRIH